MIELVFLILSIIPEHSKIFCKEENVKSSELYILISNIILFLIIVKIIVTLLLKTCCLWVGMHAEVQLLTGTSGVKYS